MKNVYSLWFLFVLLILSGCKSGLDRELTLSEQSFVAPKQGAVYEVEVDAKGAVWDCVSTTPWIVPLPKENKLLIQVLPNPTSNVRSGKVLVNTSVTRAIEIEQEAQPVSSVSFSEKKHIHWWEETIIADVDISVANWQVSCSESWIQLEAKPSRKEVFIEIKPNEDDQVRSARIVLQTPEGKEVGALEIEQEAYPDLVFPFLNFDLSVTPDEIFRFESARNNRLLDTNGEMYQYQIHSKSFTVGAYVFSKAAYSQVILLARSLADLKKITPAYVSELKKKGFTLLSENIYFEKKSHIMAHFSYSDAQPTIEFVHIPQQSEPYPTFKTFPQGINNFSFTQADISQWEKANGGELDSSQALDFKELEYQEYKVSNHHDHIVARGYWTWKTDARKDVEAYSFYVDDVSLALWSYNGKYQVTNEFTDLMIKNGYFLNTESLEVNIFEFVNQEKKKTISVTTINHSAFDKPLLFIEFARWSSGSTKIKSWKGKRK